jgi:hypothetical protein
MSNIIKKLPAVFQTTVEKKFFDATFDQVMSKKDSDYLAGFLGRRVPGQFDPISDFYVPEPTKDRTRWQLEPTAYSRDETYNKTNIFFYEDLLDKIEYYGGNTLNQDRMFESDYYSWAPPIDYDMFVNYHNYYWIDQGLAPISITGVLATDIIGKTSFTTPVTSNVPNLTLSTGMTIILSDDPNYIDPHVVEFMGGCKGIQLIQKFSDLSASTVYRFLPWDATITQVDGTTVKNAQWDTAPWEIEATAGSSDYITIQRGSANQNAWSRSNKWVHVDTINKVSALTSTGMPANATRALRPIIQFVSDIELYKSGNNFLTEIRYGFGTDSNDAAIIYTDFYGKTVSQLNSKYGINLKNNDLVTFFDETEIETNWDMFHWAGNKWDTDTIELANSIIFKVIIDSLGLVTLVPWLYAQNGDIVYVTDTVQYGASVGQSWFYDIDVWSEVYNDKTRLNQPPIFNLVDHEGISLDDASKYPESSFSGSKIFSYQVSTTPGATVDPVLGFPLVYTSFGQSSDIMFENDLISNRYTYGPSISDISGYYYYKIKNDAVLHNGWELHRPCICGDTQPAPKDTITTSKQRVIDQFAVGYDSEYIFRLSVVPYGFTGSNGDIILSDNSDIIVSVNGTEIKNAASQPNGFVIRVVNNLIYVDLTAYLTALLSTTQSVVPVVEIATYTQGVLDPAAHGYFEIPQQLEANPSQLEISKISGSDLTLHFSSIIKNQLGFTGYAYGGSNNYRDSLKDGSLGSYILQNIAPTLKSMLVSSDDDLDFIPALRFSQDEYTKFKNRYVKTAFQLMKQEFKPTATGVTDVAISVWVDTILKTVNVSREFSDAFAYSYMVANGTPFATESHVVNYSPTNLIILDNFVDLTDNRNAIYVYDVTGTELLLTVGYDYEIFSTNSLIEIKILNSALDGHKLTYQLFKNPAPAYIPSTPTKVGAYSAFKPHIELDTSFANPANVIVGHDGSRTLAYGDYRDNLLLELETRIYNLLQYKHRNQYNVPLRIESVKSGYYRKTRYSYSEYLEITESHLNKWSSKNKANYRANDWAKSFASVPVTELWKLYNYRSAVHSDGVHIGLPGHWKGIFQYFYDTIRPNTCPWEMLGLTEQPSWWVSEYGPATLNSLNEPSWTSLNTAMWTDLSNGVIRQGPSAIFDPQTGEPLPQAMWARPGLLSRIPVDHLGDIVPVTILFDVAVTGNPFEPFDGFDEDWVYGDGAPVEQAWKSTSEYVFSLQEFMYLMRPGPFGELLWDTIGTDYSPTEQYVQNDVYSFNDKLFAWMRPKNADQYVHAENVDGTLAIRFGYQRWISDRILFLGKDVRTTFGVKVRYLDVNLANKLAGFTNKDTVNTYISAVSPGTTTNTLGIPSNNFDVILHKGPPVNSYSYSGVIVRCLSDGTFAVYGYDLLNAQFVTLDRTTNKLIDITVGGTPAPYTYFTVGQTYNAGDIVRYNGIYYSSLSTQTPNIFDNTAWQKLKALPVIGGISVSYKPVSANSITTYPYGTVFETAQEVVDFLTGWGAYLESQGWKFDDVDPDTNIVSDWLSSIKQYLFWLNSSWAPDASIQLSPIANSATLTVSRGYPNDVEMISNGVYSILNKFGTAISPNSTVVDRNGQTITVSPIDIGAGGIYFLQVNSSETEHVLIFDNVTNFNDTVYSPLLRVRQNRIRFNGFRSNGWYGRMEAPGYLVIGNQLVPNYDTIVNDMRYYYDPDVTIDNSSLEDLGRRLIGFENKSYLDNLQVSNDVQYLFYQGVIRQKGTSQALSKLFRSTEVQSSETLTVYEEWALKLGDFGNTVEQVSTEFILTPEQDTGEVVIARLNYVPSEVGTIKQINIFNAETIYKKVPTIKIDAPNATPSIWSNFYPGKNYRPGDVVRISNAQGNAEYYSSNIVQSQVVFDSSTWTLVLATRPAKAYAILDASGKISRIDMTDTGAGYASAVGVTIVSDISNNADRLYSVWQGDIYTNGTLDNIVDIDINDSDTWVSRPLEPGNSLVFPTTPVVDYTTPNAGYVHFNDVDWYSFSVSDTAVNWGTPDLNPTANDTVWVANTFTGDWSVYKMDKFNYDWKIVNDGSDNLLLVVNENITLGDQMSEEAHRTDLGNMICLQVVTDGSVAGDTNYAVCFSTSVGTYTDPSTLVTYNSYNLVTLSGSNVTVTNIPLYETLNSLLTFRTLRFVELPDTAFTYMSEGDRLWVDDAISSDGTWAVYTLDNASKMEVTPVRVQEDLINTFLFENARVFANSDSNTLVQLPVYDPFKGILPGVVKQNLTYTTLLDPARYNVTGDTRMLTNNIVFGEQQVGQLWWDISTAKYVYYEMPLALDGSETDMDNLRYRRDNWGQLFPGSSIDVYEWVKSPVTPANYTGTGTPKSTTSYVEITTSNAFTNITETNYYFWVKGVTTKPNIKNRTLTATDVATLLKTPKGQGYSYFCPIQQTSSDNSYLFYNVQEILSYQGKNVRIEYRQAERNDQPHAQWSLFREGDKLSSVSDQYWNKLVDSLCGYTQVLSAADKFNYSIPVTGGQVLPVPDPNLSSYEKYGISYRPRQSMFVDIQAARKIFVQATNSLLSSIGSIPTTWTGSTLTTEDTGVIQIDTTVYTVLNSYNMSVELRTLLGKLKTEVFIDDYYVNLNLMFASMLNYVLSEQKTPDWVFKTSYINIKESNVALTQDKFYLPDQISNVIDYITDVKPYHTQVRDYTKSYVLSDYVSGTAVDKMYSKITLSFGPSDSYFNSGHWDMFTWDTYNWDKGTTLTRSEIIADAMLFTTDIQQFMSQEDVYTVPVTFYDASKKGLSSLFPYTFNFDSININNPQSIITPTQVVAILKGTETLIAGRDFYVETDGAGNYTAYLFNNPGSQQLTALVWLNGGALSNMTIPTYRNEYALGFPVDNTVMIVDTKLPMNVVDGHYAPFSGWGTNWDGVDPNSEIGKIIVADGGSTTMHWDVSTPDNIVILPNTVSFKQTVNDTSVQNFYRNADIYAGVLQDALADPTDSTENVDMILIYSVNDILPNPTNTVPGVIWINGERIEYKNKVHISFNLWELRLVRRGTKGTVPTQHPAYTKVFVEEENVLPAGAETIAWAGNDLPGADVSTVFDTDKYTSVAEVSPYGLWYGDSKYAEFLKAFPGKALP